MSGLSEWHPVYYTFTFLAAERHLVSGYLNRFTLSFDLVRDDEDPTGDLKLDVVNNGVWEAINVPEGESVIILPDSLGGLAQVKLYESPDGFMASYRPAAPDITLAHSIEQEPTPVEDPPLNDPTGPYDTHPSG